MAWLQLVLVGVVALQTTLVIGCLEDFKELDTGCYYAHSSDDTTWVDATAACAAFGGQLISIETTAEFTSVSAWLTELGVDVNCWTAAEWTNDETLMTDAAIASNWYWPNGVAIPTSLWDVSVFPGEPNAANEGEPVVVMRSSRDFKFNDWAKEVDGTLNEAGYVCEMDLECRTGWTLIDGSCYFNEATDTASWDDATDVCEGFGAKLISMETTTEFTSIANWLAAGVASGDPAVNYWTAAHWTDSTTETTDAAIASNWYWPGGEDEIPTSLWDSGEPNAANGGEPYVAMKSAKTYHLNDCKNVYADGVAVSKGYICEMDVDDCAVASCENGGQCVDGVASYSCVCAAGYAGDTCGTDIDDCAEGNCENGGSCVDGVDSYSCVCAAGDTGENCETATASPVTDAPVGCPDGYISLGAGCYFFESVNTEKYAAAFGICNTTGDQLIALETADEFDLVQTYLQDNVTETVSYWTSAQCDDEDDCSIRTSWTWPDGAAVPDNLWITGEPVGNKKQIQMWHSKDYKLEDAPNRSKGYICEMP